MGKALYRDYRPKTFDEVVGQDHIIQTLKNAIKSGKISHAYLFTGPRGVGKTTIARILAHEVNQLPYDESIHLDIIEIDAASNRRIDEIRELRDKVRVAPATAKHKVYIIDEVHMLTREAFNALLKTLEEPPAHCIFILATTEAHKLPETIISRTQRFEFKPMDQTNAEQVLGGIAKAEKIDIDPAALEILAQHGQGSFRDSISLLDQLSSYGQTIGADDVRQLLGLPIASEIAQLDQAIGAADAAATYQQLQNLEQKGISPQAVASALAADIRAQLGSDELQAWQIELLSSLVNVSASQRPKDALEIALFSSVLARRPASTRKPAMPRPEQSVAQSVGEELSHKKLEPIVDKPFNLDMWDELLGRAKHEAASIYTALRLAKPSLKDHSLILSFEFPLHQKKLAQTKNKELVSHIIEEICGDKLAVESVLSEPSDSEMVVSTRSPEPSINEISSIFGGAEVLEG